MPILTNPIIKLTSFKSMRQLLARKLKERRRFAGKRNRIRNSKRETFQQFWERVKRTGDLDSETKNPLDWSMETEREKALAEEFKSMSNWELGVILLELSCIVGKRFPLNDKVRPLREFVDRLDEHKFNNLYFANVPAHLEQYKMTLRQTHKKLRDEMILKLEKGVEDFEKAKVLVFEIVNRWNRT
jgi:hypothetical protein